MTRDKGPDDAPANGGGRRGGDAHGGALFLGDVVGIGIGGWGGDVGGPSAAAGPPPHAGEAGPRRSREEQCNGESAGDGGEAGGGGEPSLLKWGGGEGLEERGGSDGHWRGQRGGAAAWLLCLSLRVVLERCVLAEVLGAWEGNQFK